MTDGRRFASRPYRVAAIPGDGVGPEVVDGRAARASHARRPTRFGFAFDWTDVLAGGAPSTPTASAIRARGRRPPCGAADAILLGAVGGPKWDDPSAPVRPEQALFALRGGLGLFANLRPGHRPPGARRVVAAPPGAARGRRPAHRPRADRGLYFGERARSRAGRPASATRCDTLPYTEREIARIVRLAFELARGRRGRRDQRRQGQRPGDVAAVADGRRRGRRRSSRTSTLEPPAGRLVRDAAHHAARPTSTSSSPRTCSATSCPTRRPCSPARSACCRRRRSASAQTAHGTFGLYEPIHGSAPDIAGQDRANPIGTILSAAMLLRCRSAATMRPSAIEAAVGAALDDGWRTGDLADAATTADDGLRRASGRPAFATAVDRRSSRRRVRRHRARPMSDRPVILYDTTLRDGTQGENITLSLADKLRIARMLDEYGMPYIEGGWPGSNPKDIEFFAAARTMRWQTAQAGRVRLDPPPRQPARGRPEPARAGRGRDAGRDHLRQDLAAPRDRGPGRHARPRTST